MNDVSAITPNGIMLDLHVEDESRHQWIRENHQKAIGIDKDILANIDINVLSEIVSEIKM